MNIIEKYVDRLAKSAVERMEARADSELADVPGERIDDYSGNVNRNAFLTGIHAVSDGLERNQSYVGDRNIMIDFEALAHQGFLVPGQSKSITGDELQMIKRRLLMNCQTAHGDLLNVLLFTSSMAGEGKTFLAINMAISMAQELDRSILLVDADATKSASSEIFGIEPSPGLFDILSDRELALNQVIVSTNLPNLSILPCGPRVSNSTELLASNQMRKLIERLAGRDDNNIVIFDAPPLLMTTEASVLAQIAGQIVVVVEEQKTRERSLSEALSHLDKDKHIGLVLNKSIQTGKIPYYAYEKPPR